MMRLLFFAAIFALNFLQATPAQVIIIRHGEQPTAAGDNNLSTAGYERANALSPFFQMNPEVLEFGLPVAIFSVKPYTDTSRRSLETITPLAEALGYPVHTPCTKTDTTTLANLILNEPRYDGKMVLICWEHNQMASLTLALGGPQLPHYPDDRYDLIYMLTYTDPSSPTYCCGLEELMEGDPTTVPAGFPPCN